MTWKNIDDDALLSDDVLLSGIEVLLFNENWIEEDYNPKGVRVGYHDDVAGWVSAKWCSCHDCYHTRTSSEDDKDFEDFKGENQIPTHYMEIIIDIS